MLLLTLSQRGRHLSAQEEGQTNLSTYRRYCKLVFGREERQAYRSRALLYLESHPEVTSIRADVISLTIVAERTARLRHLIGAYQWTED